jgi:hypothetical protein
MAGYIDVSKAITAAKAAIKQRQASLKILDTIRTDLRNAVARGEGTPEEQKWVADNFPIRERTRKPKTT